jgi:hypothetical protein
MFLHTQGSHVQRPQYHDAPYGRAPEHFGREQERMLAQMRRQRHIRLMGGHSPGLGGIAGHQPVFLGIHGMSSMMGGLPHHHLPPQMGMGPTISVPMGLSMGSGMGIGMGMDMGMSRHLGLSPHMGRSPQMGMGLGTGIGIGRGQPSFGHSPYGRQRHSPFGYESPGPPRTHSFLPQQRHAYSPFGSARHNPFSPPSMIFGDDDYEDMYRTPPSHHLGRSMRGQPFGLPPQRRSRRRGYQRSMFGESEDEYDDYEDYDDDYDDEDMFGSYFSGQSPRLRTLRY